MSDSEGPIVACHQGLVHQTQQRKKRNASCKRFTLKAFQGPDRLYCESAGSVV